MEDNIITLIDEEGEEVKYEIITQVKVEDNDFLICAVPDQISFEEEEEAYIFKVEQFVNDKDEEDIVLTTEISDDEYEKVLEEYERQIEEMEND